MPEIWKPQPREVYISWCQALQDEASEELSQWEFQFVESILGQLQYKNLSQKQAEILEKIYSEKTK